MNSDSEQLLLDLGDLLLENFAPLPLSYSLYGKAFPPPPYLTTF
jgi:hypothetical protein